MKTSVSKKVLYDTWLALRRTTHVVMKARDTELKEYGVSSVEAAVLDITHNLKGQATSAELSRRLLREHHTISSLVHRMVKKGLLTITKDSKRPNVKRLSLTEEGYRVHKKAMKLDSIKIIMAGISEDELQSMKTTLLKMRESALKDLHDRRKLPFMR